MTYDILQDIYFINFLNSKKTLSNESIKGYKRILRKFSKANNKPLSEIIIDWALRQLGDCGTVCSVVLNDHPDHFRFPF